jgi:hypothetical protein
MKLKKGSLEKTGYNFFTTVRGRLALLLIAIIVPILIVQIIIYRARFEYRSQVARKENLHIARAVAQTFYGLIEGILNQELSIGLALTSFRKPEPDDVHRLLNGTVAAYPYMLQIAWIAPTGRLITVSDGRAPAMDVSDQSYFREIVAGREWSIGDLNSPGETGPSTFTVSRSIRSPGALEGIVSITILADALNTVFPVDIDRSGQAVFCNSKMDWARESRNLLTRIPFLGEALAGTEIAETVVDPVEKEEYFLSMAPVRSTGWAAGVSQMKDQAVAPIYSQLWDHLILFSLVVLLSILAFLVFTHSI